MRGFSIIQRSLSCLIIISFLNSTLWPSPGFSQSISQVLPPTGTMLALSESYQPAIVSGITIHPDNPLKFDFLMDTGDSGLQGDALKAEAQKMINYFLTTITVPDEEMWVNLSPYEKDRIIANGLGQTEMGRDMLVQDYFLKQLTSSLMYPEGETGKKFWEKIYEVGARRALPLQNMTEMFNKVWIVPESASVYVHDNNVFVASSHLKVMLEEDYLAAQESGSFNVETGFKPVSTNVLGNDNAEIKFIIRQTILPVIEEEVNHGKTFANLRQIYNSMLLATWYKRNLKESLLGQVYMDRNKIDGIDLNGLSSSTPIEDDNFINDAQVFNKNDGDVIQQIYNQYVQSFKVGVYDYMKEEYDPATQQVIPRKYFSGGLENFEGQVARAMLVPDVKANLSYHVELQRSEVNQAMMNSNFNLIDIPIENIRGKVFFIRTNLDDAHFDLSRNDLDDIRLHKAVWTIRYLSDNGGKVILFNHIGRPNGKYDASLKTDDIAEALSRLLQEKVIKMDGDISGDYFKLVGSQEREVVKHMQPGDVIMLENTRMDLREQSSDPLQRQALAQDIVSLAPSREGMFVMDGFPVSHRDNTASITEIADLLPSVKGLWQSEEEKIHNQFLQQLMNDDRKPLMAIFGGAKEDKSVEISEFSSYLRKDDVLVLGGKFATTLLNDNQISILRGKGIKVLVSKPGEDIDSETLKEVKTTLSSNVKIVFWEGPLGKFEEEPYQQGTFQIIRLIAALTKEGEIENSFISGGELGYAAKQALDWNEANRDSIPNLVISTGGGTSIAYFAKKGRLPGILALKGFTDAAMNDDIFDHVYAPRWLDSPVKKEILENIEPLRDDVKEFLKDRNDWDVDRQHVVLKGRTDSAKEIISDKESGGTGFDWNKISNNKRMTTGRSILTVPYDASIATSSISAPVLKLKFKGSVIMGGAEKNIRDKIEEFIEKGSLPVALSVKGYRFKDIENPDNELVHYLFDLLMSIYKIDGVYFSDDRWLAIKNLSSIQSIDWLNPDLNDAAMMAGKAKDVSWKTLKSLGLKLKFNPYDKKGWLRRGHLSFLYHSFEHTMDVAATAYRFAKSRGLSEEQATFLYQVGLLHDYDPHQIKNMPARTGETLKILEEDFYEHQSLDGRQNVSVLKTAFGWDERKYLMARAIIQRSDYPFGQQSVLAYKTEISKMTNADDQAFVIKEAALFSEYADKTNTFFLNDFDHAVRRISHLWKEMKTAGQNVPTLAVFLAKNYESFISRLGREESFEFDKKIAQEFGHSDLRFPLMEEVLSQMPSDFSRRFKANVEAFKVFGNYVPGKNKFFDVKRLARETYGVSYLQSSVNEIILDEHLRASILEITNVMRDLSKALNVDDQDVVAERKRRSEVDGGFDQGIVLKNVYDAQGKVESSPNKLVRDNTLEKITAQGKTYESINVFGVEYQQRLLEKLKEEFGYLKNVLADVSRDQAKIVHEIAAVEDVLEALEESLSGDRVMMASEGPLKPEEYEDFVKSFSLFLEYQKDDIDKIFNESSDDFKVFIPEFYIKQNRRVSLKMRSMDNVYYLMVAVGGDEQYFKISREDFSKERFQLGRLTMMSWDDLRDLGILLGHMPILKDFRISLSRDKKNPIARQTLKDSFEKDMTFSDARYKILSYGFEELGINIHSFGITLYLGSGEDLFQAVGGDVRDLYEDFGLWEKFVYLSGVDDFKDIRRSEGFSKLDLSYGTVEEYRSNYEDHARVLLRDVLEKHPVEWFQMVMLLLLLGFCEDLEGKDEFKFVKIRPLSEWNYSVKVLEDLFEEEEVGFIKKAALETVENLFKKYEKRYPKFDKAMMKVDKSVSAAVSAPGGIDLNSKNLNLQEQGQKIKFDFSKSNFDPAQLQNLQGLRPIITGVEVINPAMLNRLLGRVDTDESKSTSDVSLQHPVWFKLSEEMSVMM